MPDHDGIASVKLPNLRRKGRAYFYDHGGRPRRWEPLGTDEAAALRRYHAIRAINEAGPGTVQAMLADRLAALDGEVKPATLVNYRQYAKHLGAVFGALSPADLTQADILEYLDRCPRMSFRGEIALLSSAYVGWMRDKRVTFNPCFGVRTDRRGSRRQRLLEHAELDAIIAQCDERIAVLVELLYATGLRIAQLCALRWVDIGESTQSAKKGRRIAFERTADLDAMLARARALQARVASLYVVCQASGAPWAKHQVQWRWNEACRRAGVADAHLHDVRARAGTDKDAQEGPKAAQGFLGHRSPRTTEIYLRDKRTTTVRPLARKKA